MKIFVLDDALVRLMWFRKHWDDVTHVMTPSAAEKIVKENEFDIIFLDHDLGWPYLEGSEGDGIDFALIMARDKLAIDTPVILHSCNPVGAKNMANALSKTHNKVIIWSYLDLIRNSGKDIEAKIKSHYGDGEATEKTPD